MDGTFLTKNREDRNNSSDDLFIKPPQVNLQKFNLLRLLLLAGEVLELAGKGCREHRVFYQPGLL